MISTEWSDEQMKELLDKFPLEKGYAIQLDPLVLDLSIDEVWDAFFSDDSPFFFDTMFRFLREKPRNETKWLDVEEDEFKDSYGHSVKKKRTFWADMRRDNKPFATEDPYSFNTILDLDRTET